jgi:mRNA interferase HicA
MSFQRRKILRFLTRRGCKIIREGGEHTILGDAAGHTTALPRHRQVDRNTAKSIAKDMEIDVDLFLREVR